MNFRVIWKKNNYDVTFGLDKKAAQLKEHIQTLTGVYVCLYVCMHVCILCMYVVHFHHGNIFYSFTQSMLSMHILLAT